MLLQAVFVCATLGILSAESAALKEAEQALKTRKNAEAVDILKRALQEEPNNPELLGLQGVALCRMKKGDIDAYVLWQSALRRGASIKVEGYLAQDRPGGGLRGPQERPGWFIISSKTLAFEADDKASSFELPVATLRGVSITRWEDYDGHRYGKGSFFLTASTPQGESVYAIHLRGSFMRVTSINFEKKKYAPEKRIERWDITGAGRIAVDVIQAMLPPRPGPTNSRGRISN